MALTAPIMTMQDGPGAAVNVANGASAFVTPGNVWTINLQSGVQAGVQRCEYVIQAPGTVYDNLRSPVFTSGPGSPFAWSFLGPPSGMTFTVQSEVSDGNNASYASMSVFSQPREQGSNVNTARNVVLTNVASLSSYTVTAGAQNDNVSGGNVQGDVVLLVNQSTASQNGLYVVGVVTSTTAPLTRIPSFATGLKLPAGQVCEVDAGTIHANSTWKIMTAGPITVDTTNHAWYPRRNFTTATTGVAVTTLWVFSASTPICYANQTAGTVPPLVGTITPGPPGTSTFTMTATAYAGTVCVINW